MRTWTLVLWTRGIGPQSREKRSCQLSNEAKHCRHTDPGQAWRQIATCNKLEEEREQGEHEDQAIDNVPSALHCGSEPLRCKGIGDGLCWWKKRRRKQIGAQPHLFLSSVFGLFFILCWLENVDLTEQNNKCQPSHHVQATEVSLCYRNGVSSFECHFAIQHTSFLRRHQGLPERTPRRTQLPKREQREGTSLHSMSKEERQQNKAFTGLKGCPKIATPAYCWQTCSCHQVHCLLLSNTTCSCEPSSAC